jgi:hypothetical protein
MPSAVSAHQSSSFSPEMVLDRPVDPRSKSRPTVKAGGDISGCGLLQLNGFHLLMGDIDGGGDNTCLNSTAAVTSPGGGSITPTIIETKVEDFTEIRPAVKRKPETSPSVDCAQTENGNVKKMRLDVIKFGGTPSESTTDSVFRACQLADERISSVEPINGRSRLLDVGGTDCVCDSSSLPLDLTASSPFCVGGHSMVKANGTAADSIKVSTVSDLPATQILLLNGKEYEIVPLGNGHWISKHEYELAAGLGVGKDQPESQQVVPNSVCESADVPCSSPLCSSPKLTKSTEDDRSTHAVEHIDEKYASHDEMSSQEARSDGSEVVSLATKNDATEVGASPLVNDGEQTRPGGERDAGVELQRKQCNDETCHDGPKFEATQSSSQHNQITEDHQSSSSTDLDVIRTAENSSSATGNDGR